MSYTLDERINIADEMGCKIAQEEWDTQELEEFLDDLNVPREESED